MGIEYKHFLIPANPSFVPKKDVIMKINDLLNRWNLKTGDSKIYDLTNGKNTVLNIPLNELDFGQGLALEYPGIEGSTASKIMGESFYGEVVDEHRYIERITFIVGLDYRIHPSSEELSLTVVNPPFDNSIPIDSYCQFDNFLHYGLHAEAYSSSILTVPPQVDVWVADEERIIGGQNFLGYWRAAFIIDCGKDLPKIDERLFKIPNKEFIKEFETALGSDVIEIGEVY
jgi:hypothetical protein